MADCRRDLRRPRPYITARIHDEVFLLHDGDEAQVNSDYVYLARSNQKLPAIAFEFVEEPSMPTAN